MSISDYNSSKDLNITIDGVQIDDGSSGFVVPFVIRTIMADLANGGFGATGITIAGEWSISHPGTDLEISDLLGPAVPFAIETGAPDGLMRLEAAGILDLNGVLQLKGSTSYVLKGVDTSFLGIGGSNGIDKGANILLYSDAHATNAGDAYFRDDTTSWLFYDKSASLVTITPNLAVNGTVDGRDIAADGTKLDGIEALADVTDTANVTAAGALMDSELTDIAAVKAFSPGWSAFTPVVADAASGGTTCTVGTNNSKYSVIDDTMFFTIWLANITKGSASGNVYIRALPETSSGLYYFTTHINDVTFSGQVSAELLNGQSYLRLAKANSGSGKTYVNFSDLTASTSDIFITGFCEIL